MEVKYFHWILNNMAYTVIWLWEINSKNVIVLNDQKAFKIKELYTIILLSHLRFI